MTDNRDQLDQEIHERWLAFTYDFGSDAHFENGLIRSLEIMEKICGSFFGKENASRGFDQMVHGCFPHRTETDAWKTILDEEFAGIYSETPIGQLMHDLTAYADHGIVLSTAGDLEQREQLLTDQIHRAQELLDFLPTEFWGLNGEHLVSLIHKSIARWKVDFGEHIDARELSILSGLALQTIKNKLAGKPAEIVGNQNRIESREATGWLSVQKSFKPSIWRQQDDSEVIAEMKRGLGKVMFLPVAKDGGVFHPGLRREGKYVIGDDAGEREFEDFQEALHALQALLIPQWRRPTQEGTWTRVRAVEWRRYSEDDLSLLATKSAVAS
ncbi:hypothetical protein LCL97_23915 [Seohaeicola saemankumensis]|nr:hypothetical protein [Seohaeicola saemankumensis]MCA0873889.1 hypothetical protein [Seohaeicola saemankumensis]